MERKKSQNITKGEKSSWKFVYILASQCRSPFNSIWRIFWAKNIILWDFIFSLKLVGTPCITQQKKTTLKFAKLKRDKNCLNQKCRLGRKIWRLFEESRASTLLQCISRANIRSRAYNTTSKYTKVFFQEPFFRAFMQKQRKVE